MKRLQTAINCMIIGFGFLFWMIIQGTPAYAHKVVVFAWVEGDMVHTESKFAVGRKAKNTTVAVYDQKGETLLTGKTDENGAFSFLAPIRAEMKVVLKAGMGHQGEWVIPAAEFSREDPSETQRTDGPETAAADPAPAREEGRMEALNGTQQSPCLDPEAVQRLMDQLLDQKLEPISKALHQLQNPDHKPGVADIFGGIGYIFGLVGVGSYFHARRKQA